MKRFVTIMFFSFAVLANAQQAPTVAEEFDFVMYLVGSGMKDEAVVAVERTSLAGDSISFLRGYALYSARLLDSAAASFSRVGSASPLFNEAMFFASLSNAHLGHYHMSEQNLGRVAVADVSTKNLKTFELAGLRLLERDLVSFDSCFSLLDTTDYRLSSEAADLMRVRDALSSRSRRYPWVAGALSAVIPGLGKVYAGNVGEGVAAFLVTGSLIAVTAENWVKEGPANWKTIGAGLLSVVFYVGNIYGSVATVKVNLRDFNYRNDVQILYDIHIPLRVSYRH